MTLEDLSRRLDACRIDQPHSEALNLMELATDLPRVKILAGDFRIGYRQKIRLRRLVRRRKRLPLAYLKGEKEFYGRDFYVSRQTMIPRPESEDLIGLALGERKSFGHVYDIGAGNGCLGISYVLAQAGRKPKAYFLDNSRRALLVAQKNCRKQALEKTEFILADLAHLGKSFFKTGSLVFANLPYLDKELRRDFERNCPMLKNEPAAALYAGEKGLKFYRLLFQLAKDKPLTLVCESLENQQAGLDDLAVKNGFRLRSRLNLASLFV